MVQKLPARKDSAVFNVSDEMLDLRLSKSEQALIMCGDPMVSRFAGYIQRFRFCEKDTVGR